MDRARKIDPDALLGVAFAVAVFGLIGWGIAALWPFLAILGAIILLFCRPVLVIAGLAVIVAAGALGQ